MCSHSGSLAIETKLILIFYFGPCSATRFKQNLWKMFSFALDFNVFPNTDTRSVPYLHESEAFKKQNGDVIRHFPNATLFAELCFFCRKFSCIQVRLSTIQIWMKWFFSFGEKKFPPSEICIQIWLLFLGPRYSRRKFGLSVYSASNLWLTLLFARKY